MADSWPYPLAQEIWDQLDNTFSTEDDYEDLTGGKGALIQEGH